MSVHPYFQPKQARFSFRQGMILCGTTSSWVSFSFPDSFGSQVCHLLFRLSADEQRNSIIVILELFDFDKVVSIFHDCSCSNPSACMISCNSVPCLCHVYLYPRVMTDLHDLLKNIFPLVFVSSVLHFLKIITGSFD